MALIRCPECSGQVSTSAAACPSCGYPVSRLTDLGTAIKANNLKMVEDLIRIGVDVNSIDKKGRTPLMTASSMGNASIIQALLEAGADAGYVNRAGETALKIAAKKRRKDIAKILRTALIAEVTSARAAHSPTPAQEAASSEAEPLEISAESEELLTEATEEILAPTEPVNSDLCEPDYERDAGEKSSIREPLRCLDCGGPISPEDITCPGCNTLIVRRYCSHCSKLIPAHSNECAFCGKNGMENFRYSPHPEAKWISLAIVVLFVALLSVVLWHKPQETSQRPGVGEARAAAESLPPSQGLPSPELQEPEPETIVVQSENEIIDSPVAEKPETRSQTDKIASTRGDISKTRDRKALPQPKKSTPEISRPVAVQPQDQKETKRDTAVAHPTAEVPESREEIVREWEASVAESQEPKPGISNVERERRARRLNNEGYTLMKQGRITEAIPLLEQSVRSFPKGTSDPYYGYALFNLARALRITGRPDLAVPLLEERIKIKNQQDVVARELSAARKEAGNVQVTGIQYE